MFLLPNAIMLQEKTITQSIQIKKTSIVIYNTIISPTHWLHWIPWFVGDINTLATIENSDSYLKWFGEFEGTILLQDNDELKRRILLKVLIKDIGEIVFDFKIIEQSKSSSLVTLNLRFDNQEKLFETYIYNCFIRYTLDFLKEFLEQRSIPNQLLNKGIIKVPSFNYIGLRVIISQLDYTKEVSRLINSIKKRLKLKKIKFNDPIVIYNYRDIQNQKLDVTVALTLPNKPNYLPEDMVFGNIKTAKYKMINHKGSLQFHFTTWNTLLHKNDNNYIQFDIIHMHSNRLLSKNDEVDLMLEVNEINI